MEKFIKLSQANLAKISININRDDTDGKKYVTKNRAGDVDFVCIPDRLAIITESKCKNAISLRADKTAYLQCVSEDLTFENGRLSINGIESSVASLKDIYTNDVPKSVDLGMLQITYSAMLGRIYHLLKNGEPIPETFSIYIPDYYKAIGRDHLNDNDIERFFEGIKNLHRIVGVFNDDGWAVLLLHNFDRAKKTVTISSPYFRKIIEEIFHLSVMKDKKGNIKYDNSGTPLLKPSHSYLVKSEILKEKNKRAIEIVYVVVALIERAGGKSANIMARTIVDKVPALAEALKKASAADKNKVLYRAFSKAWLFLSKYTALKEKYENIFLPDPKDVPTYSKLDTIKYTITHEGKKIHSEVRLDSTAHPSVLQITVCCPTHMSL